MPRRVPTISSRGHVATTTVGPSEMNDPAKSPYRIAKVINPPSELTALQTNPRIEAAKVQETRTYRGPTLSAIILGILTK